MKGQQLDFVRVLLTVVFATLIAVIGLKLVNTEQAVRVKTIDVASARVEGAVALASSLESGATIQIDMGDTYVVSESSGKRYIKYSSLPVIGQGLGKSRLETPVAYRLEPSEMESRYFCLKRRGRVVIQGGKC